MKEQTRAVYIVLTDTGTYFTRLIRYFTEEPYNHASIAFDSELKEVYSFGRKHARIPWLGGFVMEDLTSTLFRKASCAVYRIDISEASYLQMRDHLSHMMLQRERYKYHLLGLLGVLFQKRIERENAYFCSHFVASLFERGGYPVVDKPAYWTTPADFAASIHAQCLFRGKLAHYLSSIDPSPAVSA